MMVNMAITPPPVKVGKVGKFRNAGFVFSLSGGCKTGREAAPILSFTNLTIFTNLTKNTSITTFNRGGYMVGKFRFKRLFDHTSQARNQQEQTA